MDTTPETEVPQSPEAQLEAIFARQTGEAKPDPEPVEDTAEEEQEAADDTEDAAEEAEDGQSEEAPEEVELPVGEEVKKFTKAELAELVAQRDNMQRGFTQKTQALADKERRVNDLLQFNEALKLTTEHAVREAAEVESIAAQLEQFKSLDWNSLIADDPHRALQLNLAKQQLQDNLQAKQRAYQERMQSVKAMTEAHKRNQAELGLAELTRRLGKLDDQTRSVLMSAAKELDYSEVDMMSPAALHALHLASKYMALQKSRALTEKKVAQAKPISAPAARSGNQSIEQSKREALKARAAKTGKSADAEAYLERLFSMKRKR